MQIGGGKQWEGGEKNPPKRKGEKEYQAPVWTKGGGKGLSSEVKQGAIIADERKSSCVSEGLNAGKELLATGTYTHGGGEIRFIARRS